MFQKKGLVCLNEIVREPIHLNVEPDVLEAMKAALTEMQQSIPTNLVVVKYWKLAIAALLSLSLFDILPSKDATCQKLHFLLILMNLFTHLSCSRWRSGFTWTILLESPSSWQWNRMFMCSRHRKLPCLTWHVALYSTFSVTDVSKPTHTNFCSNYSVLT